MTTIPLTGTLHSILFKMLYTAHFPYAVDHLGVLGQAISIMAQYTYFRNRMSSVVICFSNQCLSLSFILIYLNMVPVWGIIGTGGGICEFWQGSTSNY